MLELLVFLDEPLSNQTLLLGSNPFMFNSIPYKIYHPQVCEPLTLDFTSAVFI